MLPEVDRRNYMKMRPAWKVASLEDRGPFGWHRIDGSKAIEIAARLGSFESMTWGEILVTAKKQNHTVGIEDLAKVARDRLVTIQLDDRDDLISLRLSSRERIWGFLAENTFHLVWWDPKHQVCPSIKRHT